MRAYLWHDIQARALAEANPLFTDARGIAQSLIGEGWRSPDTYAQYYAPLVSGPALYLFLLYEQREYRAGLVAYVGMSTKLRQRLENHEVHAALQMPSVWPMRWFKPMPSGQLRAAELRYIKRFNPPWNIVGRRRGLDLE